jgi:quercetin dioxygenase-like cupin family protein
VRRYNNGVELYDWNTVPIERLSTEISRKAIHRANMTVALFDLKPGATVTPHTHVHEQVSMVQKGALKFVVDGQERIVRAGEAIAFAPNVPHGVVEILEDTVVLDVFSPAREDWPRA